MEARCSLSATQRAWDSGSPWHPIPDAHTSHRQIGEIRWIPAPFPTCSWSLEQGHVSPYHTEVSKSNLARCGSQETRCWPALCSPPQRERPGHPAIQSPHLQQHLHPTSPLLDLFQLFHLRVFPSIPHPLLPDFMRLWHLKGKVKGEHLPYRCGIAQSTGLLYSFHPRSHLDNWILLRNNQDGLRKLLR